MYMDPQSKAMHPLARMEDELPPEFTSEEAKAFLLPHYKAPLKVLESWVQRGRLIRLKRGVYTSRRNFEPLRAAGSIAHPSYVSMETALSFYGFIPEQVHTILSVRDGRPFQHRVEDVLFVYHSQSRDLFAAGMTSIELRGHRMLFASKEKALLDALSLRKLTTRKLSAVDVYRFTLESFRLDEEFIMRQLASSKLKELAGLYRNRAPSLFAEAFEARARDCSWETVHE